MIKTYPRTSQKMVTSFSRYINARGRHRAYNKTPKQRFIDWADARFPFKIKLYQVRKWPGKLL